MKKVILGLAAMAVALPGCTSPTEKDRFSMDVTDRVCNVDALAEEKQSSLATINESKRSIKQYQNRYGSYNEDTYTILEEKLNRYEAELEASYRFVTMQCGAYMRCIERNKYQEDLCMRTEARWSQAQRNFNELVLGIREISSTTAIELEKIRKKCCENKGSVKPPQPPEPANGEGCCDIVNQVFTDCCDGS